jgi:hypothetical protein
MSIAELELSLARRDDDSYSLDMRYIQDPSRSRDLSQRSETDKSFFAREAVRFDRIQLSEREVDPAAYGELLVQQLFAEADARTFFDEAVVAAQANNLAIRLRLFIAPNASDLHDLRWETFRLPGADAPLLVSEQISFCRYLNSLDWRPVNLRPEGDLRALVVVSNPSDIQAYQLAELNVEQELQTAKAGLAGIQTMELAGRGQATLENILLRLGEGFDIFYLIAHGTLRRGEPAVCLESPDGTCAWTLGRELASNIREMTQRPSLVVLASCQSAGTGDTAAPGNGGALASLGPRLAEAGVPAVVAMQGMISVSTVQIFMPVFFGELQRHGLVDRAMAIARRHVGRQLDWWMPVLFMRLRSGRMAYRPGLGGEREGLTKAPALLRHITSGRCTPILGPRVNEWLLGSRREIALGWAEKFGFPLDPNGRDSLPQVAQYLAINQDQLFVREELIHHLQRKIWERYEDCLSSSLRTASLDELITAVGVQCSETQQADLFRVLAELPLPMYITTNPGELLEETLRLAGKDPVVEICRWNQLLIGQPSVFDQMPDYKPSPDKPLVYHLFGRLAEPDSVVLTEDDYFDFLMGVTKNNDLIPPVVRSALTNTALLFLGFDLDSWDFRVLFRSIMQREGQVLRRRFAHIAAQIDPEAGRILEPEGARQYLEKYFGFEHISIYWGSVEDFAKELRSRWEGRDTQA